MTTISKTPRRRPIVFRTPEEEARLQALRNLIPKDIIELIISFVNYNPTFLSIKDIVHKPYLYYKQVGYYHQQFSQQFSQCKSDLVWSFELVGERIQSEYEGKEDSNYYVTDDFPYDSQQYHYNYYNIFQEKILKVVEYFQAEKTTSMNVFYTKNIQRVDIENMDSCGYFFQSLVKELYDRLKPDFIMERANSLKPNNVMNSRGDRIICVEDGILNFKITAKGTAQKKVVINFFKAIGRFVDWIKYEAIPIYRTIPEGLPRIAL